MTPGSVDPEVWPMGNLSQKWNLRLSGGQTAAQGFDPGIDMCPEMQNESGLTLHISKKTLEPETVQKRTAKMIAL